MELVHFKMSPVAKLGHLELAFSRDLDHFIHSLPEAVVNSHYYDPRLFESLGEEFPITDVEKHMDRATPEQRSHAEARYLEVKKVFHFDIKEQPTRTGPYNIDVYTEKATTRPDNLNKDWPMIKLVRDLSNVSTQLRQELGGVFWAHTSMALSLRGMNNWNSWGASSFDLGQAVNLQGHQVVGPST